ncbi:UNVERIFIED_CONTAM: Multidrug resistance-associated protein 1 [Siphonaria sp. JEL0065]|nr:Multidrug resistance-associated protein 1 [Siphonaria sp. JEL0065]
MKRTEETIAPQSQISWNPFTFATVEWLSPLFKVGSKKPLAEEDLPLLANKEQSLHSTHWLDSYIAQSRDIALGNKPKIGLLSALLPNILPLVLVDSLCQAIFVGLTLSSSLMLGQILKFLNGGTAFINNGYGLGLMLFGMNLVISLSSTISHSICAILQVRIKAAITNAIYQKSLRLSSKSRTKFPAGQINTYVNADTQTVLDFVDVVNKSWSMPIQLALALYFVSNYLGVATAVAAGVFLGLGLFTALLAPLLGKAMQQYMVSMDKRTTVLREFLYGVKVIKYNAEEEHMEAKIQKARREQVSALYKLIGGYVLVIGCIIMQQNLTAPLTFIAFGALGNEMKSEVIFPALSFLMSLIGISGTFPHVVMVFLQFTVSYRRLAEFLLAEEIKLEEEPVHIEFAREKPAISFDNVSFSWEAVIRNPSKDVLAANEKKGEAEEINLVAAEAVDADVFKLNDLSLSIKHGSLVAIVGATGSGKSSLLSAITGGMRKTNGDAVVSGSIAYCPQEPWIISGTIEDNITLLDDTAKNRYQSAIEACSLAKDLNAFSGGIKTQIGEKGINLSGGQKARIALARAITKNPDIYILDDPLSALDTHVGKAVFQNAIKGPLMRSKTVLIATHLLHILPDVDQVIVMDGAKIVQNGTFQELMTDLNGKLYETMKDYHIDEDDDSEDGKKVVAKKAEEVEVKDGEDEDAEAEDRQTGAVSTATYKSYANAIGSQWIAIEFIVLLVLIGFYVTQQLTLSAWTADYWGFPDAKTYLYIYSGLAVGDSVLNMVIFVFTIYIAIRASNYYHDKALAGLVQAPMAFYDQQPIGRILNRMTTDVRNLDMNTGMVFSTLIANLYNCIGLVIVTCISAPQVIPICLFLLVIVYFLFRFFRNTYRELKRLSSIMSSPLAAHISESLTGIPTILSYSSQSVFISKQRVTLDKANQSSLLFKHAMLWMTFRLDLIGSLIILSIVLLGAAGAIPYQLVGLALTQITGFSAAVNAVLLLLAEFEANMVSVERLNHYAYNLPSEAQRNLPKDGALVGWPSAGSVEIKNLTISYESRPGHLVIDGISLKINAGEKIGVVGRTGSGKSTLMDSFFRLMEATKGSIVLDGEDIATLGLKKLRCGLQMIPQNPILFDGTVRSNLDPTNKYSDDDIWYALECCGMKEYVSSLSEKLESPITEGGANLSAGQRQLICLAKVLLKKSKILIMDEATSSVDAESDLRIQESMKTHFKDATVVSIAHRLNTIAAFDKILVLEHGKVAEFEAPHLLLTREGSIFGEMVDATGVSNAAVIRDIAKEHYNHSSS